MASISIQSLDAQLLGERKAELLHDENTPPGVRDQIAQEARASFDITKAPTLMAKVKRQGALPDYMLENSDRRASWAFLFENSDHHVTREQFAGGRNAQLRRMVEIALENQLSNLINEWLPRHHPAIARELDFSKINAEEFCKYFLMNENATVPQYPAQVLQTVRHSVPAMIMSNVFSMMTVSTPSARIPVMTFRHAAAQAPFSDIANVDIFELSLNENNFYYSGGLIQNHELGAGDGNNKGFDLPISGTRGHMVFANGVKVADADITYGAGAGTGGRDLLTVANSVNGATYTADFTTSTEKGERGRDIDVDIEMVVLTDDIMKLSSTINMVDEQDARAFLGEELQPQIGAALMDRIMLDLESHCIINAINKAKGGDATWDVEGYTDADTNTIGRRAYEETISDLFIDCSDFLYQRYGRYPTYAIVGENVATRIFKLNKWKGAPAQTDDRMIVTQSSGLNAPRGVLDSRWTIYQSPAGRIPANKILMGWAPTNPMDATYVVGIFEPFIETTVKDGQGALKTHTTRGLRYGEALARPRQLVTGEIADLS